MTPALHSINPFFAARSSQVASPPCYEPPRREPEQPVYARLPRAPKTASPVPHLTSLYHFHRAGQYGDRSYPGTCGGNLIKDLLRYFRPFSVLDPMTGSGTCRDVCKELGLYCWSSDLHQGHDATDPSQFPRDCFDFCWLHPPYWRQKLYSVAETVMWRPAGLSRKCGGMAKAGRHITAATALSGTPSVPCRRGNVAWFSPGQYLQPRKLPRLWPSFASPPRHRCWSC